MITRTTMTLFIAFLAFVSLFFTSLAQASPSCDVQTQKKLADLCGELNTQAQTHHDEAAKPELTVGHLRSDAGQDKVDGMNNHVTQIHDLQQQLAALFAACKVKKCPK